LTAVAILALVVGTAFFLRGWLAASSRAASRPDPTASAVPAKALPPAASLRIQVTESNEKPAKLLDPAGTAWNKVKPTAILLNRTPRIYQTEPVVNRAIPACQVRALRAGGKLYLRMQWDDATKNAPKTPPTRTGEAKHLPRRPTGQTATFADAAAVMVPKNWTGPSFPSLLMGDKKAPAILYYWNASRGAEKMKATGRTTPQPTGKSFSYQARHDGKQWTLTMSLADPGPGYPLAFAVWDGQLGDRDGLKFFSIWYVLARESK
jgi:hypothetical protein